MKHLMTPALYTGPTIAMALLLAACSGISTSTDYDPAANFSSYGTYSWVETEGKSTDDLTDSRIRSAVRTTPSALSGAADTVAMVGAVPAWA